MSQEETPYPITATPLYLALEQSEAYGTEDQAGIHTRYDSTKQLAPLLATPVS